MINVTYVLRLVHILSTIFQVIFLPFTKFWIYYFAHITVTYLDENYNVQKLTQDSCVRWIKKIYPSRVYNLKVPCPITIPILAKRTSEREKEERYKFILQY